MGRERERKDSKVWREEAFGPVGVLVDEAPSFRADQMPYGGVKDSGNAGRR